MRCSGIVAALLLFPSSAAAADYYVATDGDDDSGDGSAGAPWATIAHAVNSGISAEGGDTVLVRDGAYSGLNTLTRAFSSPVVVRAENDYGATLTNVAGGQEALRVYIQGSANLTIAGFVMSNLHGSYTCPNGRESFYLVHLQDVSDITLENNILIGNNAPGTCNEVLKINRGGDTYPRNIVIRGNVFSEPANAGGSDLIDSVRPGELEITDNIFFGNQASTQSQSFITIKRQAPPDAPSAYRYKIQRNVFVEYSGKTDQAFLQFGEDGVAELEVTNALVENNLFIGNSASQCAAPMQLKGAAQVVVRANTIVGDLPSGAFGFRIGTEGDNPTVGDISITNNVFSDPSGTMTNRLVNSYGDVDLSSVTLLNNLFWNGGNALPDTGAPTPTDDLARVEADPLLETDQSNLVLPSWSNDDKQFASGATTIRAEFIRLVEAYGAIGDASAAKDAADASDMPAEDIRGFARDGSPDIGAYEAGAMGDGGAGAGGGGVGGSGSGGEGAGASGAGGEGTGGSANSADDEGGCGCTVVGAGKDARWAGLSLLAALALCRRRRGMDRATPLR